MPWLMKHDDCPCCRTIIIEDSDLFPTGEGGDNNESSSNIENEGGELGAGVFHVVNGLVSFVRHKRYSLLGNVQGNGRLDRLEENIEEDAQNFENLPHTAKENNMEDCQAASLEQGEGDQKDQKCQSKGRQSLKRKSRRIKNQKYRTIQCDDDEEMRIQAVSSGETNSTLVMQDDQSIC